MCAPSMLMAQLLEIAERTLRRWGSGESYEDKCYADSS
jgi:hypothetical protein